MESGKRIRGGLNNTVAVASLRDGYDDLEDILDGRFLKSELEVEKMMCVPTKYRDWLRVLSLLFFYHIF